MAENGALSFGVAPYAEGTSSTKFVGQIITSVVMPRRRVARDIANFWLSGWHRDEPSELAASADEAKTTHGPAHGYVDGRANRSGLGACG